MTDGYVQRAIDTLDQAGHLYEKDGALWFRATHFGDDKDRVVRRENGVTTYFASDLGYLLSKFERGFERALYIFGADHHGYIARLKAAAQGLGLDPAKIEIQLVQFAVLYRGGSKVQMSTRSGQFVTLAELREDVGTDAARFFYVMRGNDQHLDFDLDLAKSQSNENPVYYIQYAHARVHALLRQAAEKHWSFNRTACDAARAADRPARGRAAGRTDALPRGDRGGRRRPRAAGVGHLPARAGRRLPQLLQRRGHPGARGRPPAGTPRPVHRRAPGAGQRPAPAGRLCAGAHVVAARRGKPKSQARRGGGTRVPGWVWLLAGVLLGLAVSAFILLREGLDGRATGPTPNPQAQAPASSEPAIAMPR